MTTKHTDKVEITASITHSQGQPPLELKTETTTQQGASIPVSDSLDSDTIAPKLSTSETTGTFCKYFALIQLSLTLNHCHLQ